MSENGLRLYNHKFNVYYYRAHCYLNIKYKQTHKKEVYKQNIGVDQFLRCVLNFKKLNFGQFSA